MTDANRNSSASLPRLFHHRWAVPTLAALDATGGAAKFVTLRNRVGASRDSLRRTLRALIDAGLVRRNPGHGHPMRPEYMLTRLGRRLAPASATLLDELESLGIEEIALNKWSLPVACALEAAGGRFGRVRAALGEVTPRALARALRDLQRAGIVERRLVDGYPPYTEYRLTGRGRRLKALVLPLARPD